MKFNEDSRVKIPAILHLTRLGYSYLSLKDSEWNIDTNIFTGIFKNSVAAINPGSEPEDIDKLLEEVNLSLENEDLGKAFYEKLTTKSGLKLIDFENFTNNTFNVVTELTYKNGDEEFRPDIILLVNGMPLVFIEVKKPNNREGIIAERERINRRFQNKKFRRFVNITQLMVFSNNMEYDDEEIEPIQGVFYASPSYYKPIFNYFREEEQFDLAALLRPEGDALENFILKDNNLNIIKYNPEFLTNKNPDTPTNRVSTSLFCKERLAFMLQYAFAYVKDQKGYQKHIMRYPQIFATKAIETKLNDGIKKGIIWHTQGSGKTALAYYNVKHLTDYYQKKSVIPKFYFIVDRLDLATQAKREFASRGLVVHTVSSRDEFAREIKKTTAVHNHSGKPEITVVNIQKFKDDPDVISTKDYDINIQRVYFLDEVHRSYNPRGSFLANLKESDPNSVKIGLTGTPLLGDDYNSKLLFGNYIHKYYYNASIADGYTLRLIREEIATNYKMVLAKALDELEILKGDANREEAFAHHNFVEPMLDYIINDFESSRVLFNDCSIGGMVVCDSSKQAKALFEIFSEKYSNSHQQNNEPAQAAEPHQSYGEKQKQKCKVKSAELILHDVGTKEERKLMVEDFKDGKIDFLFVYNMLLTGFDAPRLKKLYLGRVIKRHNLLQTLTRVNRTYKDFKYGYVVDFADIRKEFDATNKAYFDELQAELGDEMQTYSNLFKSKEEIEEEIADLKEVLFHFDTSNAEVFQQQISQISSIEKMQQLKKVLGNAKELYNLIRLFGHYDLLEKVDFDRINILYREASNHLDLLHLKETVESSTDTTNLLNVALEDVLFMFTKIKEEELIIADQLKNTLRITREALAGNFDKKDPEFISLKEELERLFKNKKLNEISQEEMKANIESLRKIHEKIKELNRQNNLLRDKYKKDEKYARIHKRLMERGTITQKEIQLFEALEGIKNEADETVLQNSRILSNESYFEQLMIKLVINKFVRENNIKLDAESSKYINSLVVKEYMNDFNGVVA
ncbi:type I restriction endonuclease subunit R [Maribellus luteus]|uniref:type I site-specific deoxyribonuclease n=1 Tax=Maribellus luteus TaxID=2305463 RepID=A0A399T1U8_9BACT|nr:type I restriction endonuclease [Maribellus luteus]RIJ48755.1 type I restriction endonuclease subunit R [Maribellus luteus]